MNARTPEFRRDDVADRLLLFRLKRRKTFKDEAALLAPLVEQAKRLRWAGDWLADMNADVAAIKQGPTSVPKDFRMADWARDAFAIAEARGDQKELREAVAKLQLATTNFAIEENPIMEDIDHWPTDGDWRTARDLHSHSMPSDRGRSTFKSPRALGIALRDSRESLLKLGLIEAEQDRHTHLWRYRRPVAQIGQAQSAQDES